MKGVSPVCEPTLRSLIFYLTHLTDNACIYKALILTCKKWSQLSSRLLYRSILVKSKASVENLVKILSDGKGESTVELSVFRDSHMLGIEGFPNLLISLLQLLPNLRVLMIGTYQEHGAVLTPNSRLFNAICNLASLKYLSLFYRIKSMAHVSRLVSSFPGLVSFSIGQGLPLPKPTDMTGCNVELPSLETLSILVSGSTTLVDYLNNWSLPGLKRLGYLLHNHWRTGLFTVIPHLIPCNVGYRPNPQPNGARVHFELQPRHV